jgi:prephenate dehydrogenase
VSTVADLACAVGAEPYFLSAEEHDSYVAAISHLPFLLSTALMTTAAGATSWRDMAPLAASGFRDTSRLAAGDPVMYRDICLTNREPILRWLDAYAHELGRLRELVAAGGDELAAAFERARAARRDWERRKSQRGQPGAPLPAPGLGARLGQLFLGGHDRPAPRSGS